VALNRPAVAPAARLLTEAVLKHARVCRTVAHDPNRTNRAQTACYRQVSLKRSLSLRTRSNLFERVSSSRYPFDIIDRSAETRELQICA
jgi:hypothetical protein